MSADRRVVRLLAEVVDVLAALEQSLVEHKKALLEREAKRLATETNPDNPTTEDQP